MRFFTFILKTKTYQHYHITLKIRESNGIFKFIETPLVILPEEWDAVSQSPTNLYNKNSKITNQKLNRIKIEIVSYFLALENTGKDLSTVFLKRLIIKICENSSFNYQPESLLFYMHNYIKGRQHILTVSTYRRYLVFLNLFERFEAYRLKILKNTVKTPYQEVSIS